jgi:hypothetical protein
MTLAPQCGSIQLQRRRRPTRSRIQEEESDSETIMESTEPHMESEQGDDEPAWLQAAAGQAPIGREPAQATRSRMEELEESGSETIFESTEPHTESEQGDDEPAWLQAAAGQAPIGGAPGQPKRNMSESAARSGDAESAAAPAVADCDREDEPMWLRTAAEILEVPSPVRAHKRGASAPAMPASATSVPAPAAAPSPPVPGTPALVSWLFLQTSDHASPLLRPTTIAALVLCLLLATAARWGGARAARLEVASDQQLSEARSATSAAVRQLRRSQPADAVACSVSNGASFPNDDRREHGLVSSSGPETGEHNDERACSWCAQCCRDGSAAALELSLAESALLRSRLEAIEARGPAVEAAGGEEEEGGWGGFLLSLSYWALLAYVLAGLYAQRTSM